MHVELRVGDGDAAGVQLTLDSLVHGKAHVEVVAACGPQHQQVLDAAVLIVVQHDQRGGVLQCLRMLRCGKRLLLQNTGKNFMGKALLFFCINV